MPISHNQFVNNLLKQSGAKRASATELLTQKMQEINLRQKEQEAQAAAQAQQLPYVNLKGLGISPDTLNLLTREQISALQAVVFLYTGSDLRIGAVKNTPEVQNLLADLKKQLHTEPRLYLISENSIRLALQLYDALPKIKKTIKGVEIAETDLNRYKQQINNFKDLDAKLNELAKINLSETVTLIIAGANKSRASDIHIEAGELDIKVRYRIDGVLVDAASLPKDDWKKIISRLKLLAGLKINVSDRPQDGRFTILLSDQKIDVRVSCLPTQFGESVVIRLLMSSVQNLTFENLGLSGKPYEILLEQIKKPNGMVISSGPTGSGKTTMMYAALNKLNSPDVKIITIEDPIEYQLTGIAQSQTDESAGYTFAKGLRSIVRQDPDIIMVGEIRDLETAEIAVQAALTGHFVLSTLHTNDAAGVIPRLLSLGAKPYLLAPALNAAVGQRLLRKICDNCKQEITLSAEILARVKTELKKLPNEEAKKIDFNNLKFYHGIGCEKCQQLGYFDRTGVFEIIVIDDELQKLILTAETSDLVIRQAAIKKGMITMLQDGLLKALQGITTVEEVYRVVAE